MNIKACYAVMPAVGAASAPAARPPLAPIVARVMAPRFDGNTVVVVITAGMRQGIGGDWSAVVLRGDSDVAVDGGEIEMLRVGESQTVGRVRLPVRQMVANPRVRFEPPRP